MTATSSFGPLLKQLREARRVSQSKLAERAGLDHSYVSRLESGQRTPTRDVVDRLSEALKLDWAENDALLHAGGFIGADDAHVLRDEDLRNLASVLGDPTLPVEYRHALRTNIRGLTESARYVRRDVAVPL